MSTDTLDLSQETNPAKTVRLYAVKDPTGVATDVQIELDDLLKNPGPIGGGTPNTGAFTSITASSTLNVSGLSTVAAVTASGIITANGGAAFEDNDLGRPLLVDYAVKTQALGSVSGTTDIDCETANGVTATIGGATTFTFSNPPATGRTGFIILKLTNGGAFTVTWPASVQWAAGTAPTLTASGVDRIVFVSDDGGTTWDGCVIGQAFA